MSRCALLLIWLAVLSASQQVPAGPPQEKQAAPQGSDNIQDRLDLAFWEEIKDKNRIDLFEAYLRKFPNGVFAPIARLRISELKGSAKEPNVPAETVEKLGQPKLAEKPPDAAELLRKVRTALGGEDRILAIRDWRRVGRGVGKNIFGKEGKTRASAELWCSTGQTRAKYGREERYFDGKDTGWVFQSGRARQLSAAEIRYNRIDALDEFFNLITADVRHTVLVSMEKSLVVRVQDSEGNAALMEVDPSNHLPLRITQLVAEKDAAAAPRAFRVSDWRTIKGVRLPFRFDLEGSDLPGASVYSEWQLNVGVHCDDLGKTPGGVVIGPPPAHTQSKENVDAVADAPPVNTPDHDTSVEAAGLLRKIQDAVGGWERLQGVKNYRRVFISRYPIEGQKERKSPKIIESWCADGSVLQQVSIPFAADVWTYFDGRNSGWVKRGHQRAAMTPSMIDEEKRNTFEYDFFGMLLADHRPGATLSLLNPQTIQILDSQGSEVAIEVDPNTNLPVKRTSQYFGRKGISAKTEERFSEWKQANGILMPHSLVQYRGGRKVFESTVLQWSINTGIDCASLQKTQ